MPRFAFALLFLALVAENGMMYAKLLHTPLGTFDTIFFQPSALKLPLFFFVVVAMLAFGRRVPKEPPVVRMQRALRVSLATLIAWTVFGLATGGVFQQVPWQIYNIVVMSLFAMVLLGTVRTMADVTSLGKVVFAAALWRAGSAILFYLFIVRSLSWQQVPPYMTTHDDTSIFCTGIVLALVHALNTWKRRTTVRALLAVAVILVAVQLNNRRLAWVSLALALGGVYFVLPPGSARRRINRMGLVLAPILALYTAVGMGRSERIFKPLSAFNSLDATKDGSTASREAENDNLITTAGRGLFVGRGFGHTFDAINSTYELDGVFDQWKYIPHNSYLGLLAFTGVLGFAGIWWPLPVAVYLGARGARASRTPLERTAAAMAVAEVVIYANQAYGDMGLDSQMGLALLAAAYATAARVAVTSGAWVQPARPTPERRGEELNAA